VSDHHCTPSVTSELFDEPGEIRLARAPQLNQERLSFLIHIAVQSHGRARESIHRRTYRNERWILTVAAEFTDGRPRRADAGPLGVSTD
jgi:hypothetical protein